LSFVNLKKALLCCAAISTITFTAPLASAESLDEALARAYRNNPTLRAERARQRATDEQVPQAKAGWRPVISTEATVTHRWDISRQRDTSIVGGAIVSKEIYKTDESNPAALSIQLTQPIFRGFKTVEGIKRAEANVAAGRQQLLSVEQDILFRAVQAYMNVIRDRKILTLRKQNVDILQEQLRAARQRFEVGEVTRTDVEQSRARVSQAGAGLATARAQLASSVAAYENLVGIEPGSLKYPKSARVPSGLGAALAEAQKINPNILAAASVEDAARHNVAIVKGDLLPEANLRASATTTDNWSARTGLRTSALVQGVVSIPIYEGGQVYSGVRQAKQIASQRRIEIIEATRAVRESVTSAWNNMLAASTTITSAKVQVAASELAANGVREEYLVGSRTTIDVLNAQQELLNARVGLVSAQRDFIVASYQVLGSMGKLTARNLHLRTNIYDPKRHYNKVKNKWIGLNAETVE
jgi:outer membrane protein